VLDWLRVWAVEKWLATKPCSTLSSELLEMFDALLVPNHCGEGSLDLRRLGNLHLQRRVARSLAMKSTARTVWWCEVRGAEIARCEEWKQRGARSGKLCGDLLQRGGWSRRGLGTEVREWKIARCEECGNETEIGVDREIL